MAVAHNTALWASRLADGLEQRELQRRAARGELPPGYEFAGRIERVYTELPDGRVTVSNRAVPTDVFGGGGWLHYHPFDPAPAAAAERAAERAAMRDWYEQQVRERQVAEARALELLLGWLSPAQRARYSTHADILVWGSDGYVYRLCSSRTFNVHRYDRAAVRGRHAFLGLYCALPEGGLPLPDVLLGQVLHITSDAPRFLAQANFLSKAERQPDVLWLSVHDVPPVSI